MSSQQQVTTLQIDERPPEIILDRKLNLPWSLNPLFIWMKIFGFQLNGRPTSSSSKWFYCVGGGTLLINLILHLTSFIVGVKRLKSNGLGPNGTNLSTANLLNMGIEHLNYTFMLTGVHTIFFIISITYWKTLCNTVRAIDQSLAFKPKFYRRCRKAVVIGMTYIALDAGSYVYMSILYSYWNLGHWRPLAVFLSNLTRTAVLSVLIVFCILTRCTSFAYEVLNHRLEILSRMDEQHYLMVYHPPNLFTARLEKWRKSHARVCQLVDQINQCFGLVLLVTLTNGFISFITTSFELVRSFQDFNSLPLIFVIIFIKKLILLLIIVYEPYQLQFEAGKTVGFLRQLHPSANLITQLRINTVILEVSQSFPKITAMEFFDVNLRLIPTLIGTTLTYVAILCQASAYANQW